MLSELTSLKVLVLDVSHFDEDLDTLKAQVQKLPPSILELNFRFYFASVLLLDNSFYGKDNQTPRSVLQPPTQIVNYGHNTACWDVSQSFPNLQKAAFVEKLIPMKKIFWRFSTNSMGIFPPTLTHLEWTIGFTPYTTFNLLPQSLTWLDFGTPQHSLQISGSLGLPPALTHLNGILLASDDEIARLPRTLVSGKWLHSLVMSLTPSLLASLPPHTQSLVEPFRIDYSDFSVPWPTCLPIYLKELRLASPALRLSDIALLPRTLESLIEITLDYEDFTIELGNLNRQTLHQIWPPNLASLSFAATTRPFSSSDLAAFPPTLTSLHGLKVDSVEAILTSPFELLPARLTSLQASYYNQDDSKAMEYWGARDPLPDGLRALELVKVKMITATVSQLPRKLRSLKLADTSITNLQLASFLEALPPSLTTLALQDFPTTALDSLPQVLNHLILHTKRPQGGTTYIKLVVMRRNPHTLRWDQLV